MPANNSTTKLENIKSEVQVKPAEVSLITKERSQKLDLLIHLISNLKQSIAVCGVKGIGKTLLLNELKARKSIDWFIVSFEASAVLSLDSIQDQLFRFLKQSHTELKNQKLSSILSALEPQNQKIIITIDDAGLLVPGLINKLIEYASENSCLIIVYSFTHDELYLKNITDQSLNDCHIVEIPPLDERQCGIFLQNLSGRPNAVVSFNAINDQLVEKVYQKTNGIPGKIIAEISNFTSHKANFSYKWLSIMLVAALLAVGIKLLFFDKNDSKIEEKNITPLAIHKTEDVKPESISTYSITEELINQVRLEQFNEIDSILVLNESDKTEDLYVVDEHENIANELIFQQQHKFDFENQTSEVLEQNNVVNVEQEVEVEKKDESLAAKQLINSDNINKTEELKTKKNQLKNDETRGDDSQWILEQPGENHTIQLIVLSKRSLVDKFINNNKNLKGKIRFFKRINQARKQYVLIYGSYKKTAAAYNEMKSLPGEFKKSWVRKFRNLQKVIKN